MGKESTYNAGNAGDEGSIPGSGRCPGGGHGGPLQCSCLENPVDRVACLATLTGYSPWGREESDRNEVAEIPERHSFSLLPCLHTFYFERVS